MEIIRTFHSLRQAPMQKSAWFHCCIVGALSTVGPAKVEGRAKADARRFRAAGSTLQQMALDRQKVNFYQNGRNSERLFGVPSYSQK